MVHQEGEEQSLEERVKRLEILLGIRANIPTVLSVMNTMNENILVWFDYHETLVPLQFWSELVEVGLMYTETAVRTALYRLYKKGLVVRTHRGIYGLTLLEIGGLGEQTAEASRRVHEKRRSHKRKFKSAQTRTP